MEIHNLDNPAYCEAMGLSNVFKAYAEECSREDIMEVGFNPNSGYVYIALENGIQTYEYYNLFELRIRSQLDIND